MADSKYIAGLVGPTLIAVTLSEIVNPDIWRAVTAPDTYQAGLLAFVGGLAIVRAHNIWTLRWPVVLTLVGWFGVAGGLARMVATEAARQSAGDASTALGMEAALLGVGLFLTFKAYKGVAATR
jgi:prepilin signal peptidase PulO-like enzyme (type II secretory pathway)